MRICKEEALKTMNEHYKEYKFECSDKLESKLCKSNKYLKKRFGLVRGPIYWDDDDIRCVYINYVTIRESFKLKYISVHKKFWFYRMKIKKFDKWKKDAIKYKDCLVESRENKIDNLLDDKA